MQPRSLWGRLITSAAVSSIFILAIAGFLLAELFRGAVERNFDVRLHAVLDSLLATVELDQGELVSRERLADTRFGLPLSGWYWQVVSTGSGPVRQLMSPSLLEQRLEIPAGALASPGSDGISRFYLTDPDGVRLRALAQNYKLFGSEETFAFVVTGNFDELSKEFAAFNTTLVIVLAVLGAGLLIAIFLQVRFGLRPLAALGAGLNAIRRGTAERLEGLFPAEIQPVADELNLLIQSNMEVVDRARTQVGNLAHALKTPLSVLANEAGASGGSLAAKVSEQILIMRDQVNLYLDRARRAARAQTIGSATELEPSLAALVRTLQRINPERRVAVEFSCPPHARFRGEKQDLEEMAGNLLDNAFKWANGRIAVDVSVDPAPGADGRYWLDVAIGDDGPGLPAEKYADALKRGHRLDETKPGSGLGLSIVSETAGMYGGGITLGPSRLGGLLVTLRLPAVG